jgi:hypothetical protein
LFCPSSGGSGNYHYQYSLLPQGWYIDSGKICIPKTNFVTGKYYGLSLSVTDTNNNQALKRCLIINLDNSKNICNVWDTDSGFNFNNTNLLNQFINTNILNANNNVNLALAQVQTTISSNILPTVTTVTIPLPNQTIQLLPPTIKTTPSNIISVTTQKTTTPTLPSNDQVQAIL